MQDQTLLSVGTPIPDWQVRVDDGDGHAVPDGTIGEIAITGGSLFAGYHKQPEETARKFRDGWYLTGDLGCQHAGELYLTGRVDDVIIVHGKNIYAHDVEFAMNQVPGVKAGRAVAIGIFVPEAGTQDLLLIAESTEPADRHAALGRAIKSAIVQLLGLAPRTVRIVEPGWLVKTTSGKISRAENLRKHLAGQQPVTP
jgi:acyl-CoA synthetase (AMP-forming)/AMP-acid ligase II